MCPRDQRNSLVLLDYLGQRSVSTAEITGTGQFSCLCFPNYWFFRTVALHEPDLEVLLTNQVLSM